MIPIVDSHCHFDAPEFDADRNEVLDRARDQGVLAMVLPAVTAATWPRLRNLAASPGMYPAYGLHPMFLDEHQPRHIDALRTWLATEHPVAVGGPRDFDLEGAPRIEAHALPVGRHACETLVQRARPHP